MVRDAAAIRKCIPHTTKAKLVSRCLFAKQIDDIEHLATLVLGVIKPCECRRHQ